MQYSRGRRHVDAPLGVLEAAGGAGSGVTKTRSKKWRNRRISTRIRMFSEWKDSTPYTTLGGEGIDAISLETDQNVNF